MPLQNNNDAGKYMVIGNICTDLYVPKKHYLRIKDGIRVHNPFKPLQHKDIVLPANRRITTDKHKTEEDLSFMLDWFSDAKFPYCKRLGGGGFNSFKELTKNGHSSKYTYIDLQAMPNQEMYEKAIKQGNGADAFFFGLRKARTNVVVGEKSSKEVWKSRIDKINSLSWRNRSIFLERFVKKCNGLFLNSMKEEAITRKIINCCKKFNKPFVAGITTSLDHDFVLNEIFRSENLAAIIANYDEFGYIVNNNHRALGDENKKFHDVISGIGKLRRSGFDKLIFVTLGSNGVIYSYDDELHHVKLKNSKIINKINKMISAKPSNLCGAGDSFMGEAFRQLMEQHQNNGSSVYDAHKIAVKSCMAAVQYIGYDEPDLDETCFALVKTYKA